MSSTTPKDPLHGKTLQMILEFLVDHYTWAGLAERINVNCFQIDPSISSSLKFLRKTPWARKKVEGLYLWTIRFVATEDQPLAPLNLDL
jgi:uncharacterized protein (DUF2132 family)